MKLKINIDRKDNTEQLTDKDLPFVILDNKSRFYYLIAKDENIDDKNYFYINLDTGKVSNYKYDSLGDLIDDLGIDEEIVEAELIIRQ